MSSAPATPPAAAAPATRIALWWYTLRPRTLPAVLGPILLGWALVPSGGFSLWTASLCLLCALSLQVAVNLANDYFDGRSGVDQADRLGPARALQSGWVSAKALRHALGIALGVALLSGSVLVWNGHWLLWLLGAAALAATLGYSGGRRPYANRALGEVVVWLFFGPIAVLGVLLAHQSPISQAAVVASVLMGLPVAAILVVNNVRDRYTDARAGKYTLAVYLDRPGMDRLYGLLLLCPLVLSLPLGLPDRSPAPPPSVHPYWLSWGLLLLLSLVLIRRFHAAEGRALNPLLGHTALFSLGFAAWLAVRHLFWFA
jgi:1,4-dihydroxy-2-naphthoate octaprenyltransferase